MNSFGQSSTSYVAQPAFVIGAEQQLVDVITLLSRIKKRQRSLNRLSKKLIQEEVSKAEGYTSR